jgi:hypothetical protein
MAGRRWKTFSGVCLGFCLGALTRGLSKGFDPDDTFKAILFGGLSVVSYLVGRSLEKRSLEEVPRPLERKRGGGPTDPLAPPTPE